MKAHIIQLEHHDDGVSIRDKISWSKADRVLLVWPRRGSLNLRQIDLILLQRHAVQMGCQMGIVTRNREMQATAREIGLAVFSNTMQAQRKTWRKIPRSRRGWWKFIDRKNQKLSQFPDRVDYKPLSNVQRMLYFLLGIMASAALASVFIPVTDVTIIPQRMDQSLEIQIRADPNLAFSSFTGGIPAEELKLVVDGISETQAGGATFTPDTYATGEVIFTNLTDQEIQIPANTIVLTSGEPELRFETTRFVSLPAGAGNTVNANVRSVQPGRVGNLEAGKISAIEGLLGLKLKVENTDPLTGGSDIRRATPTENDYEELKNQLLLSLRQTAVTQISQQLSSTDSLLLDTLRINNIMLEERQPEVGDPSDRAQLSMQVEYIALVVRNQDIEQVAITALDTNLPGGYVAVPGKLEMENISPMNFQEDGSVRWKIMVTRELMAAVDIEQLTNSLLGKSIDDAVKIILAKVPVGGDVKIVITPGWLRMMPLLPYQVRIGVQ